MKLRAWLIACTAMAFSVSTAQAQEMPKPGPEHALLKRKEGTWEVTVKSPGGESKGTATYKMELGGLWLISKFKSDFGGMPFEGRGIDTYDFGKKKYTGMWIDSMSTKPIVVEGEYDKAGKVLTSTGEGPGMDGKIAKLKMVDEFKDENTMVFTMYQDDKETMVITYKRKK